MFLKSFNNFVFLSPHFDDAVLSCGLLLNKLQENKKNILVVTVFTKASKKPYSKEAKVFVHKSGYKDAEELFLDREVEDKNALRLLGAKHLHLGFTDTEFRKNNFWEKQKLRKNLKQVINNIKIPPRTLILAPLGVGNHPDHLIINKLVKSMKRPTLFWEDFPYNTNLFFVKRFFEWNYKYKKAFSLEDSKNIKKIKAIKMYKSQINMLFGKKKIPNLPEKYFYLKKSRHFTNFFADLAAE